MIASFPARLYAAGAARYTDVIVTVSENGVGTLRYDGIPDQLFDWNAATVSDRIGDMPRRITIAGGAVVETTDNQAIDQIESRLRRSGFARFVSFLERHKTAVAASLVIGIGIIFGAIKYGVPAAANTIAHQLPPHMLVKAGNEAEKVITEKWTQASTLEKNQITRLQNLFNRVLDNRKPENPCCKLRVASGGMIGANALALPNGTIIITDEMVKLAKTDAALTGVFAHEIAHLEYRHSLRSLIETAILSTTVIFVTGDIGSLSELLLTLPVFVLRLGYSRDYERAADGISLAVLKDFNMNPADMADMFAAMEKGSPSGDSWISSHPATDERVKRFKDAAK